MPQKLIMILMFTLSVSPAFAEGPLNCDQPQNTKEINECASQRLEAAEAELAQYLEACFKHNARDLTLVKSIKAAQKSWESYRSAHCDSVGTHWRTGTIRGLMYLSCEINLTKQRTHELWRHFLTYMDSSPPVLPEPKMPSK